jgi:hypothetical protein
MLIAVIAAISLLMQPATLEDGRCSVCKWLGLRSTVLMSAGMACTAMFCGSGYYDEDGRFHAPQPCNTCTRMGSCSRGHQIAELLKN